MIILVFFTLYCLPISLCFIVVLTIGVFNVFSFALLKKFIQLIYFLLVSILNATLYWYFEITIIELTFWREKNW